MSKKTKKERQNGLNEAAVEWLRRYVDWRGWTWQELRPNQVHHRNSPCFQKFVADHPQAQGLQYKFALKRALSELKREGVAVADGREGQP